MFALDISDHSIEALELGPKKRIKVFGRVILPEGIVKDGIIIDEDELVRQIKKVSSKIKSKKVVLSIPESKAYIHVFEDKNNVEEEAEKTIPWNKEEVYADIYNHLYVSSPRDVIDSYIQVLEKAGLKPLAFEVESLAIARAIKAKSSLVIDIGARTTNLSVFDKKGQIKMSVSLNKGGDGFTRAIGHNLKMSLVKAEAMKIKYGLSRKLLLILQKELQPIIKETRKLIDYYKEISQVVLVGGSAQTPEIISYFSTNTGLKVTLGKSELADQLRGKSILYNTVIGLALKKPSKGINILMGRDKGEGFFKRVFHYFKKKI